MSTKRQKEVTEVLYRLYTLGFDANEAAKLRGISMTFSRWDERECNGEIERNEGTGKPFSRWEHRTMRHSGEPGGSMGPVWVVDFIPVADREAGSEKRLKAIMANHPELDYYRQGDPRGCALYIYRKDAPLLKSVRIDCCYSTVGTAVY